MELSNGILTRRQALGKQLFVRPYSITMLRGSAKACRKNTRFFRS